MEGLGLLVQELADRLIQWLKQQLADRKANGFVIGLSGGIDSAVTVALCKRVCPDSTLGVIMPCHSDPQDALDARLVAEAFNVQVEHVVLDEVFDLMVQKLTGLAFYNENAKDLSIVNIKPRLRMTTLYYYAARNSSLVVGTSNKSERTVGYFTKHGDGGADLIPLANLVKHQVRDLAQYLGVPRPIIEKAPSAGLWAGHNDETEMGITYEELDRFILTGEGSDYVKGIVEKLYNRSEHKRQLPASPPF
nr:NAD(+) synthase [Desulfolucanica intricata]